MQSSGEIIFKIVIMTKGYNAFLYTVEIVRVFGSDIPYNSVRYTI